MSAEEEEGSVCPPAEDLEVEGAAVCPVEGCGSEFPSSSHLRMHVARHHEGRKLRRRGGGRQAFYCPVGKCERSEGGGKPFPRLGQLKQHYQCVHGRREFVCRKCGKQFGLRDVCQRHEVECGQSFSCGTCAEEFHSQNALYQHAKRKHHTLPPGSRNKHPPGTRNKLRCGRPPPVVIPLVLKQVVQIPRDEPDAHHHKPVDVAIQTEPETQSVGLLGPIQTRRTILAAPAALTLDHSDLATQTDISAQLLNFSTQTMDLTSTQACQTQSLASCELGTQTYMDSTSQFTQTCQDPTSQLTQTYSSDPAIHFTLGTQTYLDSSPQFTQPPHDPTTHFGLSPQPPDPTSQFGLCDFGTQTMDGLNLVEQVLGSSLLPPECLDFGTQTQESALEEIACIDFRELLHNRREQSSQT